jgi:hypothetical protein
MAVDFQSYLNTLLKSRTSTTKVYVSAGQYDSTNVFLGANETNYQYIVEYGKTAQSQLSEFRAQRTADQVLLAGIDDAIQQYNAALAITTDPVARATIIANRAPYLNDRKAYKERIARSTSFITAVEKFNLPINPAFLAKSDASFAVNPIKVITKANLKRITYNVGSVKEAYFSSRETFLQESLVHPGNKPAIVDNAANLWAGGIANKGMIQTWSPPDPENMNSAREGLTSLAQETQLAPYGFQFQYNPTNVTMTYSGAQNVDTAFEASGGDKFNLAGTSVSQSTIGFQILLNRVYDMKYYGNDGLLRPGMAQWYSPKAPSTLEQKEIYNKGTMYDLEYLLRTLLGVTMKSYMRENYLDGETADMGWVTAKPVELHLGQNLRYLVMVNQLDINHVLFNERMVPLFSTVNVSCMRMPDFAQPTKTETTTPAATNTGTQFFNLSNGQSAGSGLVTNGTAFWDDPSVKKDFGF